MSTILILSRPVIDSILATARQNLERYGSLLPVLFMRPVHGARVMTPLDLPKTSPEKCAYFAQIGQYVEPVQLQVVCHQLWENLACKRPLDEGEGRQDTITADDVWEAGDVDTALARFYEESVAGALAAAEKPVSEARLRTWFDTELITPGGTRGLVRMRAQETGDLPNALVRQLQGRFLLRSLSRAGESWVELVHDRFVEPIRASNAAWFSAHLSPLQRQAALWNEKGRPDGLLVTDAALAAAESWAAANPDEVQAIEREFLAASRRLAERAEYERRTALLGTLQGIGWLAFLENFALSIGVAFLLLSSFAGRGFLETPAIVLLVCSAPLFGILLIGGFVRLGWRLRRRNH